MRKIFGALLGILLASSARAGTGTITVKDSTGTTQTYFIITNGSAQFVGAQAICDGAAAANCAAVKAASTAAAATDPAMVVAISPNNSVTAAQATAASLNATVVGTGTFTVQAQESGTWNITNISGTVSLPTGAATSANQTNASQKTQIVDGSGNVIASTSNNLNVQCANCSGSGASAADAATFTAGTSVFAPTGGEFTTGGATACVTGHQCVAAITAARALFTDVTSMAGTALGAPSTYGTAPGSVNVMGVNAFVTNANANGLTTMASSSPVVIASDQKVSTQNASAAINISTATTTQLVALSGGAKIYVNHWDVVAGGTGNITLEYGTGTACATGTTVLTGAYNLTAQAGISAGDGAAPVLVVPAGNALCALTSAAVQMSGAVAYQQF